MKMSLEVNLKGEDNGLRSKIKLQGGPGDGKEIEMDFPFPHIYFLHNKKPKRISTYFLYAFITSNETEYEATPVYIFQRAVK